MAKKKTPTLHEQLVAVYGENPGAWPQWTHTEWTCACGHENDPRDDAGAVEVAGSVECQDCGAERPLPA